MFEEGQVFDGSYPPEAAYWCNDSGEFHIEEIEPIGDIRRFKIVANQEWIPTAEEQIGILQANLAATDYVAIKIMEGVATREDYADVIAQRQAWREEINTLEKLC